MALLLSSGRVRRKAAAAVAVAAVAEVEKWKRTALISPSSLLWVLLAERRRKRMALTAVVVVDVFRDHDSTFQTHVNPYKE